MQRAPAIAVHLFPLVPLTLGYWYWALAAVLVVSLAYIKTKKMDVTIALLEEKGPGADREWWEKELAELKKLREFWRRLTFLP